MDKRFSQVSKRLVPYLDILLRGWHRENVRAYVEIMAKKKGKVIIYMEESKNRKIPPRLLVILLL